MAPITWLAAVSMIASAAPLCAREVRTATVPDGTSETRYCMRLEAVTGSRIEQVRCWTRAEWRERGVDLDRDWPEEGVRTIG